MVLLSVFSAPLCTTWLEHKVVLGGCDISIQSSQASEIYKFECLIFHDYLLNLWLPVRVAVWVTRLYIRVAAAILCNLSISSISRANKAKRCMLVMAGLLAVGDWLFGICSRLIEQRGVGNIVQ